MNMTRLKLYETSEAKRHMHQWQRHWTIWRTRLVPPPTGCLAWRDRTGAEKRKYFNARAAQYTSCLSRFVSWSSRSMAFTEPLSPLLTTRCHGRVTISTLDQQPRWYHFMAQECLLSREPRRKQRLACSAIAFSGISYVWLSLMTR